MPVTPAADLIEYLLARDPGWFKGRPPGASSLPVPNDGCRSPTFTEYAIVVQAAARPRHPRGTAVPPLSFPQAFRRLWWQQWDRPPSDQRNLHWYGVAGSLLIHLSLLALLLWVAVVRWVAREPGAEPGRVQIAFYGRGTPDRQGGGEGHEPVRTTNTGTGRIKPRAAVVAAVANDKTLTQAPTSRPAPPIAEPITVAAQRHVPLPSSSPLSLDIPSPPLLATENPRVQTDFVVPPMPVEQITATSRISPTSPSVREREIETVEPPQSMRLPLRELTTAATVPKPAATVREREVTVLASPEVEPIPAISRPPQAVMPEIAIRPRELGDIGPHATPSANAPALARPQSTRAAAPPASDRPADAGPDRSTGAGSKSVDRSGGWASSKVGDDWGLGERRQAGQQGTATMPGEGLYRGEEGRPGGTSPGERADTDRGAPGGETDRWSRDRIAQSGTWLKRPPYDYTPTSFDQFWVPNQSLLEQWVREGIKKIEIAIPGTSTRISCVVSLLQFGGGCGLTNPNMNEQPALARPPPDIPFKRELQQDNGSVR